MVLMSMLFSCDAFDFVEDELLRPAPIVRVRRVVLSNQETRLLIPGRQFPLVGAKAERLDEVRVIDAMGFLHVRGNRNVGAVERGLEAEDIIHMAAAILGGVGGITGAEAIPADDELVALVGVDG